ncbi:MAG TPA: creatininase family protein, partial [Cyclobacteriaceae bacterium]|nr:creatininase family protein [Cyclobacteriaceae bacterium]
EASAKKGERYFKAVTQKVSQFFVEIAKTNKDDFYV